MTLASERMAVTPGLTLLDKKYMTLSGGGSKGKSYNGMLLAYDFILRKAGVAEGIHSFKGFAGSSAGALWAMMLAMNASVEEIFDMSMSQDTAFIFQHINVMQFPKQFGMISNTVLIKPLEHILERKGFSPFITLRQLYALTKKDLEICVTCVNLGAPEMWNHRTTPDIRVTEAVATSMSIPVLFSPTQVVIRSTPASMAQDHTSSSSGLENEPAPSVNSSAGAGAFVPPVFKGIQIVEKPTSVNASVAHMGPRYYVDGGLTINVPHHVFDPSKNIVFRFEETADHSINSNKEYLFKLLFVPIMQADRHCMSSIPDAHKCNVVTIHTGNISILDLSLDMTKSCGLVHYGMYQMLDLWKTRCKDYDLEHLPKTDQEREWLKAYFVLTVQLQLMITKLNQAIALKSSPLSSSSSSTTKAPTLNRSRQSSAYSVLASVMASEFTTQTQNHSSHVPAPLPRPVQAQSASSVRDPVRCPEGNESCDSGAPVGCADEPEGGRKE